MGKLYSWSGGTFEIIRRQDRTKEIIYYDHEGRITDIYNVTTNNEIAEILNRRIEDGIYE